MTWAFRRRLIVLFVIFLFIGGVSFWHYSPDIFRAPTCSDGKQNGLEIGIDCGGTCTNMCTIEVKQPTILWVRSFPVTSNVYNAAAYIENNNDAATRNIPYEFRFYDDKGVFITRVDGFAIIPPLGRYAIVESGINVGMSKITRTTFTFSSVPATWEHIPTEIKKLQVATKNIVFDASGLVPRLTANALNISPTVILHNTTISAILYDKDDNAVNVSRTIIPVLGAGISTPIFFTWPGKLSAPVVRSELLPIIDVFHTE